MSENTLFEIVKSNMGVATLTVKIAVIDAEVYSETALWVAVIIVLPEFIMVTSPLGVTVATSILLLVNINVPLLVEVGSVNWNGDVP
jgi:CRISPR/Cas system-associated exonuclease Cas4 (RecB family)